MAIQHDIFIKAISQGAEFCNINNPRAWLFQVARNYLIDTYRKDKKIVSLPEDTAIIDDVVVAVDELAQCLPRVLSELNPDDGNIIRSCDIDGMTLRDYAEENQLTLTATKSRIQRARKRLRENLIKNCKVIVDKHGAVCCFTPRK
nr:sigma-70 family RNA polymerase sigma factor [uncultured Tolumonas sp.]